MSKLVKTFSTLLLILSSMLLTGCNYQNHYETTLTPPSGEPPTSFADIVDTIMPSIVYIQAQSGFTSVSGSGVIMRPDGYILTNRHVVETFTVANIMVTLENREVYTVTDKWMDDLSDLAVIKIDASDLSAAHFGDADTIDVGDWVIALGHPLGLSPNDGGATVTTGIVSNLDRSFTIGNINYYDVIQTDAAINPGNSGGPLVDLNGLVIGINSAGATSAQNIGYAINVSTVKPVFEGLSSSGHEVVRPFIGAVFSDVTSTDAERLGLTHISGALITELLPGYPAAEVGMQVEDVIISFDGEDIASYAELIRELWKHTDLSQPVEIKAIRDNQTMTFEVTLVPRPDNT